MRLLFGGLIAITLLVLYVFAVWYAIAIVNCISTEGCVRLTLADFTEGFATTLATIGGLVSALVIAELAITQPGEAPAARLLPKSQGATLFGIDLTKILKIVTALYLLVWALTGLAAFVIGVMLHPGKLQPLTDLGQTWLGLAVSAAYTYLGVKPPRTNEP